MARALTMPKELRSAVREACRNGWTLTGGGDRHYKLTKPGHQPIIIASSTRNWNAAKNALSLMRREGAA